MIDILFRSSDNCGMTKTEAIKYFGSPCAIANALGCAQSSVSEWVEIPEGRQYQIELATKGRLKADKPALRVRFKRAA